MYNKIPLHLLLWLLRYLYILHSHFSLTFYFLFMSVSVFYFFAGFNFFIFICNFIQKKSTTLNPLHPDKATTLITTGFFKFSRNPMYLGMLLILISISIRFNMLGGALNCIIFIFYMNKFQIAPEEKAMEKIFAEEFIIYKNKQEDGYSVYVIKK